MQLEHDPTILRLRSASASWPADEVSRRNRHVAPGGDGAGLDSLAGQLSLINCLDLRARYRAEEVAMHGQLRSMQADLEATSRQIWHHLASGEPAPASLRSRCADLVAAVEALERDLADVRLAIEGVGEEIAALLARRLRCSTPQGPKS
jgi:hypothetical protein